MLAHLWRRLHNRSRRKYRSRPRPPLGPEPLEVRAVPASLSPPNIVTGPDMGLAPRVAVFDAETGTEQCDFLAYDVAFTGGVRVAVGDVTGDGAPEIITAPGPGSPPNIRVYSGQNLALLASFMAFNPNCFVGVFVAVGNFDTDAALEVVAGLGSKPRVRVFNITGGTGLQIAGPLGSFLAFGRNFRGGVRVAAGNVDGQAGDELITAPGPGTTPRVRVFASNGAQLITFLAYANSFRGGVFVATGDVDGDGRLEVITGPGQGSPPSVRVFVGATGSRLNNFLAFDAAFTGGVRVAAVDADGDNRDDIIAGVGPGAAPRVSVIDGQSLAQLDTFFAYDQSFQGGVFVAGI